MSIFSSHISYTEKMLQKKTDNFFFSDTELTGNSDAWESTV